MKTKATRKMQTKGVRPRPDQIEALETLMERDPELDWSKAVRRGLDLFLAERLRAQAEQVASLFQGVSASPSHVAQARQSAAQAGTSRTSAHEAERRARSSNPRAHS